MMSGRTAAVVLACSVVLVWPSVNSNNSGGVVADAATAARDADGLWLAPEPEEVSARVALARAVSDMADGEPANAIAAFTKAASDPVLGGYALLYLGRAQLKLERPAAAVETAERLLEQSPSGFLEESALWLAADAGSAASDWPAALRALQRLDALPIVASPALVQLRLGQAAIRAGDRAVATRALTNAYFEFPLSPEADDAKAELTRIGALPLSAPPGMYRRAMARAERLFAGRQYAEARAAYESVRSSATGDDRQLVSLRQAECDFYLKRYPTALAALRAYLDSAATRLPEAEYHYISTLREIGRTAEYLDRVKSFVDRGDDPALAERALNDLGTFHILADDDGKAAGVFAELYRRFPTGSFADRAAWKAGWWAYRTGDYAETIQIFESASVGLRRADFRPAWLYWAAKAHLQLGHPEAALQGFARAISDYRNSYYGRAAIRESERIQAARRPAGAGPVSPASLEWPRTIAAGARPDNADLIEGLLAAGMYDEAMGELRRLQATGGASPLVEATIAFALNRQGKLRPAITSMRRAYPQFMAAGGEALPRDILTVIFPVDHWDMIRQHATEKRLDRFLLAALIAQESTFQADVRSSANAWGLMQILPSTGSQIARRLGIRPFSTRRLTDPRTNLLIGTTFFADLLGRFGDEAPALAAYNAGGSRVVRWLAERPGLDRDEFIDDIPFPETQNYVKRILGTAEDYRKLYR